MPRIEPTRKIALQFWWAFIWRAFLLVLASGFALGVIFGLIGAVLHISPDSLRAVASLLGLALGVYISVEVMFRLLRKKFKTFQIILATPDEG